MAGTTQTIKREWAKTTSSVSNFVIGAKRAFYEQFNNVVIDLETLRVAVAANIALLNQLRASMLNMTFSNPAFAIKSNFDVQNANAVAYTNSGTLKTLAAAQTFDTGTTQVIATGSKWSSALLSASSANATVVTWSATLNAASEAAAIAALPALPANNTPLGYITVQSDAAATWTAGTDALATGTGGTPAQATNYYNSVNPNAAQVGAAVSATTTDTASDLVASSLSTVES